MTLLNLNYFPFIRQYFLLCTIYLFSTFSLASGIITKTDSLIIQLQKTNPDTNKLVLFNAIIESSENDSIGFFFNKEMGSLAKNLEASEKKEIKNTAKKYFAAYLNNMGYYVSDLGQIENALDFYKQGIALQQEINDEQSLAVSYNNLALLYKDRGNIIASLEYYHKCLAIQEKYQSNRENKLVMASCLNNIGIIYDEQNDKDKALEYYFNSLKIQKEIQNQHGIAVSLNSIAIIYFQQKKYTDAIQNFERCLKIWEKTGKKNGVASMLNSIGTVNEKQGNDDAALDYFNKSLKIREDNHLKDEIADSYCNIGKLYFKKGNYVEGERLGLKSLEMAKELGFPTQIRNAADLLRNIYRQKKMYDKALEMQDLYFLMRDSINNQNTRKASIKKQLQYEYAKKTETDSLKNSQAQQVAEANVHYYKQTRNFALIGSLLMIVVILFGYNRYRLKQKVKYQKELTNLERKALHLQMNPHFIFNALGSIGSFIVQNDKKSSLKYLARFAKLMRIILENSKDEHVTLHKEMELLNNYLELEQLRCEHKFNFSVNEDIEMAEQVVIPPMMIQPFVENAILHGILPKTENGNITIRFYENNNKLVCEVEDDGVGRAATAGKKNFDHHSMATEITQNRMNAISTLNSEKMQFWVEDKKNGKGEPCGTKVILEMPVKYNRINLN